MAILLATGEDSGFTGFPQIPTTSVSTTRFRPAFSRCALSTFGTNPAAADPPVQRLQLPPFTPSTIVYFHCIFWDSSTTAITNGQSIIFRSPDGVARIVVRSAGTSYGTQKVSSRNAAGSMTDLATFSISYGATSIYVLDMKIDYTPSGGVQAWLNGTMGINYVGNPRTDAATQINQIEISNLGNNGQTNYSEIIIADQDTRGMALWTLPPTAAGNTQGWTPNTVGNINEIINNDGTFVSTTVNNTLSQWDVSAAAPAGAWSVMGFIEEARVQIGASGPQHMDWNVRTGGLDYLAGATVPLNSSFNNYQYQWPVNPSTGVAWAVTDFTDPAFNYGVQSLA